MWEMHLQDRVHGVQSIKYKMRLVVPNGVLHVHWSAVEKNKSIRGVEWNPKKACYGFVIDSSARINRNEKE